MISEIQPGRAREILPGKETETKQVSVIALSGLSGSGKTTAANFLIEAIAEYTGKKVTFLKVGEELVRNPYRNATGKEIIGSHRQTDSIDAKIKATQVALIHQKPADEVIIIDGWLTGVVAAEEKQKAEALGKEGPNVISFLIYADFNERMARGYSRQQAKDPTLTFENYKKDTKSRTRSNKRRWRKQHKQLKGVDFYGKKNKDNQGKPIYTYVINNTKLTENQFKDTLIGVLIANGHIAPKSDQAQVDLHKQAESSYIPTHQYYIGGI